MPVVLLRIESVERCRLIPHPPGRVRCAQDEALAAMIDGDPTVYVVYREHGTTGP